MKQVTVFYGLGQPKNHSVRYVAVSSSDLDSRQLRKVGDIYVSREILGEIGATDKDVIVVTYSKEDEK